MNDKLLNERTVSDEKERNFYTPKEISDIFGVTVQAVFRWIQENKINFTSVYNPGFDKEEEYRIPKKQFELNQKLIIQRLNELRKIQELKKKVEWDTFDLSDIQ